MNTVFGPPTNLQITPDGKLALVAKFPGNKVALLEIALPGHPASMRGRAR